MKCMALTHKGLVRSSNEDSFFIPQNGENIAAVCDGMGGHLAGEVASRLAIESLVHFLKDAAPGREILREAVLSANIDVYRMAQDNSAYSGMGTTLTAIWWDNEKVFMGHVGDSRLYRFDGKALRQLSHDHTLVQELVDFGEITAEQARTHPQRHLITRAVGTQPRVDVDTMAFERENGCVYLICSDGLTNMLTDDEICEILHTGTPQQQLDALIATALDRGGIDNITAVLAFDGEGEA